MGYDDQDQGPTNILVGAHHDSIAGTPRADDNAFGVAWMEAEFG